MAADWVKVQIQNQPDEVSQMSSERELVFVAGHRPIYGNKLRYYLQPYFTKRLKMYQEIYVKEHGYQEFCKKYPNGSDKDCKNCVEECKVKNGVPAMICPTYPLYSDNVTKVLSFEDLFAVNAGEKAEREEKAEAVRFEKEYAARKEAKEKAEKEKIDLTKENETEEQKTDENNESVEGSQDVAENDGENQGRNEITEIIGADGENLGGEVRESEAEESQSEIAERKIAEKIISSCQFGDENAKIVIFGESLSDLREYEESLEQNINGAG